MFLKKLKIINIYKEILSPFIIQGLSGAFQAVLKLNIKAKFLKNLFDVNF